MTAGFSPRLPQPTLCPSMWVSHTDLLVKNAQGCLLLALSQHPGALSLLLPKPGLTLALSLQRPVERGWACSIMAVMVEPSGHMGELYAMHLFALTSDADVCLEQKLSCREMSLFGGTCVHV